MPVCMRSFEDVYAELSSFDPKKHLITSDLKLVNKRSFSTWMGRIFTPKKYKAANVVNAIQKYIEKNGLIGKATICTDGETKFLSNKASFTKSAGMNRFYQVLTNGRSIGIPNFPAIRKLAPIAKQLSQILGLSDSCSR